MPYCDPDHRNIALVVDDSPESLSMISTALEENGISVVVARNGAAALELAARVLPDVILMDAVMPDLDGFETCRRLKADERLAYAPVIFMTGLTESEHIIKGLMAGGVDYLTKPAVIDELVARITTHILNAKAIQSARQALDTSGRSVVAVNLDGTVLWGSPKAMSMIEPMVVEGVLRTAKHADFEGWLSASLRLPASPARTFMLNDIALSYIGTSPSSEILLKVSGQDGESPYQHLERTFGLTPREAEVLFWLSLGKTNRDIAQILDLSSRTINKHLETIFQKMGVDNRTAAAVSADRAINQMTA
ncbi:response regulator [Tropicimonas sp. S265A]|uniref:response regulator n=1 Tax=Tropicimonas sp. S265A TaxID=3415134 RepID=UPI003C7C5C4E